MNAEKLKQIFAKSLDVPVGSIGDDFRYNSVPQWDSVAHMALVAAIEDEFDILLETEDVIDMSTFAKAKEIVAKHGVAI